MLCEVMGLDEAIKGVRRYNTSTRMSRKWTGAQGSSKKWEENQEKVPILTSNQESDQLCQVR